MHKFKEVTSLKKVLASAHALVKKVNKSSKATERLVSLCGKKLISDCPTRWSSTFLMLQRLLTVKDALSIVLEELCWDNLPTSEWKVLASIHDLLKPFAQYTSLVGEEDYTTVSSVIPIVMEINLHLEETRQSPSPQVSTAASVLLTEFKCRFRNLTDPSHPDHDPLFLASTLLDPRYRLLLNPNQITSAKAHLMNLLKDHSESSESSSATQSPKSPADAKEPPTKRFCHLASVLEQRLQEDMKKQGKKQPGEQELETYMATCHSLPERVDPVTFWIEQENMYPLLATLAVEVLTMPASSTPVERVFSTAGESSGGKRNRLSNKHLEREVLLRKNKAYIGV